MSSERREKCTVFFLTIKRIFYFFVAQRDRTHIIYTCYFHVYQIVTCYLTIGVNYLQKIEISTAIGLRRITKISIHQYWISKKKKCIRAYIIRTFIFVILFRYWASEVFIKKVACAFWKCYTTDFPECCVCILYIYNIFYNT